MDQWTRCTLGKPAVGNGITRYSHIRSFRQPVSLLPLHFGYWLTMLRTNYIVDVYIWSAATALAAATVVRSLFGAIFPLFASQMYENLGTHWASTVVGFIALVLA